jgi:hypothetical protein
MGIKANVSAAEFPTQGELLNARVRVAFNYGRQEFIGTVGRWDVEEPHVTIIRLADGRYVLGSECQYAPMPD